MKKLIVLLVVLALSAPVLADVSTATPMQIDLGVAGTSTPKTGWQEWDFASPWNTTNPKGPDTFVVGAGSYSNVSATMTAFGSTANPPAASRARDGGMAFVPGTGEFGSTTKGYGTHYLELSLSGLEPSKEYQIELWSWETHPVWSMNSANPNSKFVVWCANQNPMDWCLNNGYDGSTAGEPPLGGYGPKVGTDNPAATTDSNMPAGLAAIVAANGGRTTLDIGTVDFGDVALGSYTCKTIFRFTTSPYQDEDFPGGTANIFGWNDCTDYAGSNHTPLSGFRIVPEPATMVLLGLGGLALIRRKRA